MSPGAAVRPLRLTLVRHGVTEWNLAGRWQGHADVPLAEAGRAQARLVGPRLAGRELDLVVASDLRRALDTARLALPGVEPKVDARLREIDFGEFDGLTSDDNERHPVWEAWVADPYGMACPGGESFGDLLARARAWLASLPEAGEVVAFSHGGAIHAIVHAALDLAPVTGGRWPFPWRFKVGHGSLSVLERLPAPGGPAWVLERLNDDGHLAGSR